MTSQVTGRPRALAGRMRSSDAAVETWVRWSRAPGTSGATSASSARARATAVDSAATGQPRRPSTVEMKPSFASAPSVSEASSACSTIGSPSAPGVGQRRAQDRRRADRRAVVREADDAGVGQLAERRELLPCPPDRDRPVRQQLDGRPGGGGRRADLREHAWLVERRRRVRHRADGREAAVRGGGQTRPRPSRHPRCRAREGGCGGR